MHVVANVASAPHFQPLLEEEDGVLLSDSCAMSCRDCLGECLWHALLVKLFGSLWCLPIHLPSINPAHVSSLKKCHTTFGNIYDKYWGSQKNAMAELCETQNVQTNAKHSGYLWQTTNCHIISIPCQFHTILIRSI